MKPMGIFAFEYCPQGYIKGGYYLPFSDITAGIITGCLTSKCLKVNVSEG